MHTKRSVVTALVGLNVLLLGLLLAGSLSLPTAYAQSKGGSGEFLCVTAKVAGQGYDALYLLDRSRRRLHAFYPKSVQSRKYSYGSSRDLAADFGR